MPLSIYKDFSHRPLCPSTHIADSIYQHTSRFLPIKGLRMVEILEPDHITRPLGPSSTCQLTDVLFACEIPCNSFGIDDEISAGEHHGHIVARKVFLPEDVVGPEEAAEQGVGDAHVLGGEVRELVLVGMGWLAVKLNHHVSPLLEKTGGESGLTKLNATSGRWRRKVIGSTKTKGPMCLEIRGSCRRCAAMTLPYLDNGQLIRR